MQLTIIVRLLSFDGKLLLTVRSRVATVRRNLKSYYSLKYTQVSGGSGLLVGRGWEGRRWGARTWLSGAPEVTLQEHDAVD